MAIMKPFMGPWSMCPGIDPQQYSSNRALLLPAWRGMLEGVTWGSVPNASLASVNGEGEIEQLCQ